MAALGGAIAVWGEAGDGCTVMGVMAVLGLGLPHLPPEEMGSGCRTLKAGPGAPFRLEPRQGQLMEPGGLHITKWSRCSWSPQVPPSLNGGGGLAPNRGVQSPELRVLSGASPTPQLFGGGSPRVATFRDRPETVTKNVANEDGSQSRAGRWEALSAPGHLRVPSVAPASLGSPLPHQVASPPAPGISSTGSSPTVPRSPHFLTEKGDGLSCRSVLWAATPPERLRCPGEQIPCFCAVPLGPSQHCRSQVGGPRGRWASASCVPWALGPQPCSLLAPGLPGGGASGLSCGRCWHRLAVHKCLFTQKTRSKPRDLCHPSEMPNL